MMRDSIESKTKRIVERIYANDLTALADARALAGQYPEEPKVWRVLAHACALNDDYLGAVAAETREIALVPPSPALFFTRGRYALCAGDYPSAIADFTEGLGVCDELKQETYREVLHFFRAEAFVQLGRKAEARADLEHVGDDCTLWTIEVRTKAELVALAAE